MVSNPNNPSDSDANRVHEAEPQGQAAQPTQPDVSPEVKSFYERYSLAMKTWVKDHGNTNFPITEIPTFDKEGKQTGTKLIWLNRETRKKLRKAQKKHGSYRPVYREQEVSVGEELAEKREVKTT